MALTSEFRWDVAVEGTAACITVGGELDGASSGELRQVIASVLRDGPTSLDISLREVSFMDSGGLRALLAGRSLAENLGVPYGITELSTHAHRLLELTGLHDRLVKAPNS